MFLIMWVLILALGIVLLLLGTLPVGRFPGFADDLAILRAPYGRILGAVIIGWAVASRMFLAHQNVPGIIAITVVLLVSIVVCLFLSVDEPVR